jgi:hypothetical protein
MPGQKTVRLPHEIELRLPRGSADQIPVCNTRVSYWVCILVCMHYARRKSSVHCLQLQSRLEGLYQFPTQEYSTEVTNGPGALAAFVDVPTVDKCW